jgi:hypothetical protein
MSGAQTWMHIINLWLMVAAAVLWAGVTVDLMRSKFQATFGTLGHLTAMSGVALCGLFIYLQIDWIVSEHNQAVGDFTSYLWLIWDYALSVFMIALAAWCRVNVQIIGRHCDEYMAPEVKE